MADFTHIRVVKMRHAATAGHSHSLEHPFAFYLTTCSQITWPVFVDHFNSLATKAAVGVAYLYLQTPVKPTLPRVKNHTQETLFNQGHR